MDTTSSKFPRTSATPYFAFAQPWLLHDVALLVGEPGNGLAATKYGVADVLGNFEEVVFSVRLRNHCQVDGDCVWLSAAGIQNPQWNKALQHVHGLAREVKAVVVTHGILTLHPYNTRPQTGGWSTNKQMRGCQQDSLRHGKLYPVWTLAQSALWCLLCCLVLYG